MHQTFQTLFAQDLLAPNPPVPSKRMAVYRNNVFVGLVEALKSRFPAVRNAVGDEFFAALARDYAGGHLPLSPLMMNYGDTFPDFIEAFPQLGDYPWMADLARIERAMTQCYHAPDASPLGSEAFASLPPKEWFQLRVTLHPALELIASDYPVVTLWRMNTGYDAVATIDGLPRETALINRPYLAVSTKALSPAGGMFLTALLYGHTLGDAAAIAASVDVAFDLTAHLHLLIAEGLVTAITQPDPDEPS